ncbi:hypothetical protein ACFQDN_21705 [Pseudomonas asuensis]|uniref:DNA recombination protein RmuC n=1 Tax=Pseudomonas asuensis TaxID=1825787 RepID=A0ABQ2H2N0_9PSED|nr:hypothetical protein [Pseudomonas asuensis]GGM25062.1 hypothetical protein GCM10009425_39860 [Pseudomonas asuensis]
MDPIVLVLSVALGLSLLGGVILASLYWSERTRHHAAKAWAEAEQLRFAAYKKLIEHERTTQEEQKTLEHV